MAKGSKKKGGGSGRRRLNDDDDDDDVDDDDESSVGTSKNNLDFAERRELQRKAAAEKRRAKMRCHLCGESGHVRRECPGILDDGRGESRHKNAKGDKNATRKASVAKGARNRGRKSSKKSDQDGQELVYPMGFEPLSRRVDDSAIADEGDNVAESNDNGTFKYLDANCDVVRTIEYVRSGRGKNKLSMKEAVAEYQNSLNDAVTRSNFGGCVARCQCPTNLNRPWNPSDDFPIDFDSVWFAMGFDTAAEFDADALRAAVSSNKGRIVALFADLDYSLKTLDRKGMSVEQQLHRLNETIDVAASLSLPVQIRILSSPPSSGNKGDSNPDQEQSTVDSPYSSAVVDLGKVLLDRIRLYPEMKFLISCWTSESDHQNALLSAFPENLYFGFDGTVSFAKATTVHESAFDVPLSRLVLETGFPKTIPSQVTKALGRNAFAHSGLLPYIAEAIAVQKKADDITGEKVAREASRNAADLYGISLI